MKREVLLIFLMVVGLLTGCQAAGSTSPELPTPENLYSTEDSQSCSHSTGKSLFRI